MTIIAFNNNKQLPTTTMANSISYEHSFADILAHDTVTRISYILCRPPRRLKSKGSLILLHDFFKTNYQFRYVIDLFAMAGYTTFALDMPGKHISSRPRQNDKVSTESLSTDLAHFINLDMVQQPLHIAGIGMGAQLATSFTERHPNVVASVTVVEPQRSEKSEDALKFLSSLPFKIPLMVRRNAFDRYLDNSLQSSSILASDELDEYADSFSAPHALLNMQQAYCSFLNNTYDINNLSTK